MELWIWISGHWLDVITVGGFIATSLGLIFTIHQVLKIQDIADASRRASERALEALSDRLTISALTTISRIMQEVQVAVRGDRHEAAVIRVQDASIQLHELRKRSGFASDDKHVKIQEMVVELRKLQTSFERKIENPNAMLVKSKANVILGDMVGIISEWQEEERFTQGGVENDR